VPELQSLRPGHGPAILAFELANRAHFAASISDRGDEYFEHFTERHDALLAEQAAGTGAYYVLVAEDEVEVVRVSRLPQHLAGLGVQLRPGRAEHGQGRLAEDGPRRAGHTVVQTRGVDGPLVGRGGDHARTVRAARGRRPAQVSFAAGRERVGKSLTVRRVVLVPD